ncbi:hypothetical protein NMH_0149 [Neisseria meningitidis H44/76]|uniref:Uncharacterized protein n=3 Tax=Neisseria meningitidis TaxID=487 RepID=A0A0H5DLQ8_NEIMI|nr:hypothetical protein NMH_0149 [Neisseria meningitidis H44/76]CCA45614.1 hypothetical protein NMALPHA522_2073 [Neisseria meningitidis alpha522]CRL92484.1 hypothetical protein [Neisseria meningitidis serogroup B]
MLIHYKCEIRPLKIGRRFLFACFQAAKPVFTGFCLFFGWFDVLRRRVCQKGK